MKVEAKQYQTLFDLSLQLYGNAEGAFSLAKDNGLEMTSELSPGQVVLKVAEQPEDKQVLKYYTWSRTEPATAITGAETGQRFEESFSDTFQ